MFIDLRTAISTVGATISGSNHFFFQEESRNPEPTPPYIIYEIVNDVRTDHTVYSNRDDITIQFTGYDIRRLASNSKGAGKSSVSIDNMTQELITKFDNANINVAGYGRLRFKREFTKPATIINNSDGSQDWQTIVMHKLTLIK